MLFFMQIYVLGLFTFVILSPIPVFAYRVSDLLLFAGIFVVGRMRAYVPANIYYPSVLTYTAVFVFYAVYYSGLFVLD